MKRVISFAVIILCMGSAVLTAQPPNRGDRPPQPTSQDRDRIRNMITGRLLEYLNLNEEKAKQFFPVWHEYNYARGRILRERWDLYKKIESSVDNKSVSNDELLSMVNDLAKSWMDEFKVRDEMQRKAREILDDRQYVKLIIFEDKLKEELLQQMTRRDRDR